MKKWIALVLALAMVLPMAACNKETAETTPDKDSTIKDESITEETVPEVVAEDYDQSGTCGEDARWSFDEATGALTITGTGEMADYSLGNSAPWKELKVKSATIDGVSSIGECAFLVCTGLTEITMGDSVTSIGDDAFAECTNLTKITIPDSVTSIGSDAFSFCTGLTEITIPDSVTSIGDSAFRNCDSLTEITIPDSVTSIEARAFWYCPGLTEITIGDSVTSIGERAFYECPGLTEITIPDSVTFIGSEAFSGCTALTDVYYSGTEEQWNAIEIESNDDFDIEILSGGGNESLTSANIHYNS